VVLATGTPILDRGLHFARLEPLRSYALSFTVPGSVPRGMYLSVDQPSRSLRTVAVGRSTELLVGGEGHVVGRGGSTRKRVAAITAWTQQHFPGARCTHQWSAQDYRSTRRLPLAGRMPGTDGAVFLATGFNKWGMTNAVAAAMAVAGDLAGERPEWANELYGHVDGAADVAEGVRINAAVGARLARGWAEGMLRSSAEQPPAEGSGTVGRSGAEPVATSTVDGRTCTVSAVCTHLGGIVQWNDAELSWDCPLHGSRFTADGRRLEGPAVRDLPRRPDAVEE
jgi:nitrite reductase/ring-hydroxylating ferredoxin subunit